LKGEYAKKKYEAIEKNKKKKNGWKKTFGRFIFKR
jgi:hypothetical protein